VTGSRGRAMTLLGASFLVGIALGVVGLVLTTRAGKADWIWHIGRSQNRPGSGQQREPYGDFLNRTLKLGLDQATRDSISSIRRRGLAQMDSITQASRANTRGLWLQIDSMLQPVRVAVDSTRAKNRADIRSVLAPAQQAAFDSLTKSMDEQRRRMRDQGRGGGRSGPGGAPGGGAAPRGSGGQRDGADGPGQRNGGFDRGPQ
jgi:hypothetical protein